MVLFYLLWVEFGFFHLAFCDLRVFDFASRVVFSSLMLFDFVLEFFFFFSSPLMPVVSMLVV